MITDSIIKETAKESPLTRATVVGQESPKAHKQSITQPLMLTSLVDAFSILVVYLLMNFSTSGEILYFSKDLELPQAQNSVELERHTVVKVVEDGKYFIEEEEVAKGQLVAKLLELRKTFESERPNETFPGTLIVQADRRQEYKNLNSIVLAGAHTGYSDIKFAVLAK